MDATSQRFWNPLPEDWWRSRNWRSEAAANPGVLFALAALNRALPPEEVFARNYLQHPLGMDYCMRAWRWRLVEVGAMLSLLQDLDDFPTRLLEQREYFGACAELQVGLLFSLMGFDVERVETRRGGPQRPDWIIRKDARALGVEVKCPHVSDRRRLAQLVESQFLFHLMELLPDEKCRGLDVHLDRRVLDRTVSKSWIDHRALEDAALEAAMLFDETGAADPEIASVHHDGDGSIVLHGLPVDFRHEDHRTVRHVREAADQLRDLGLPGIVVLSALLDGDLPGQMHAVRAALAETWAREIAAVMIIEPELPGFRLLLERGQAISEMDSLPFDRLRICDHGHAHVDTFLRRACTHR